MEEGSRLLPLATQPLNPLSEDGWDQGGIVIGYSAARSFVAGVVPSRVPDDGTGLVVFVLNKRETSDGLYSLLE